MYDAVKTPKKGFVWKHGFLESFLTKYRLHKSIQTTVHNYKLLGCIMTLPRSGRIPKQSCSNRRKLIKMFKVLSWCQPREVCAPKLAPSGSTKTCICLHGQPKWHLPSLCGCTRTTGSKAVPWKHDATTIMLYSCYRALRFGSLTFTSTSIPFVTVAIIWP